MSLTYRVKSAAARFGVDLLRASGFLDGYWHHWRGELFDYAERRGIHVLPVHYYTPIPTLSDRSRPRLVNRMRGIAFDQQAGADLANSLLARHADGIASLLRKSANTKYDPRNPAFHPLDAAVLYALIRETRPQRIIEIGSGMSTLVIAAAIRDAELLSTRFTCIEPFLPSYLRPKPAQVSEIIEEPLQQISSGRFEQLEANDILFVDSTHVVRFGSDVLYEILEILPQLRPGVKVHFHDIFLPDDYPERWLSKDRFFWNEQYLLQAFLCMNPCFQIQIPVHAVKALVIEEARALVDTFGSSVSPASFWLERLPASAG